MSYSEKPHASEGPYCPNAIPENAVFVLKEPTEFCLVLDLTLDTPGVREHFPDMPIVAGYMQLAWLHALLDRTAWKDSVVGVKKVKFRLPLVPPCSVELRIHPRESELTFTIGTATGICTDGVICLR